MKSRTLSFDRIGEIFDDATTRLVGGVNANNQRAILQDIDQVQKGLTSLLQAHPEQFEGVAGIHAQNIVDQLNLEKAAIKSLGSDPFAAKYINDVQRDLIDIVQGDEVLQELASRNGHNGFAPVPDLLADPAPFQGNAEQTQFMANFVTTTQGFTERALAIVDNGGTAAEKQQLAADLQAYASDANAFTQAQGGLYSARFNNEFAAEGVHGTATRALIDGLMTGNGDKIHAAVDVMAANAADVATNMLPAGATPQPANNGIPDQIDLFAVAGTVFNDATTKLIGGVYDGNRQSIHDDLAATRQGIQDLLTQSPADFQGRAGVDAARIVSLLDKELQIVDGPATGANGTAQLNNIHARIINIVQNDAALAAAATQDGANGFMALPGTLGGNRGGGDGGRHHGSDHGFPGQHDDPLAHVFHGGSADLHHG